MTIQTEIPSVYLALGRLDEASHQ